MFEGNFFHEYCSQIMSKLFSYQVIHSGEQDKTMKKKKKKKKKKKYIYIYIYIYTFSC